MKILIVEGNSVALEEANRRMGNIGNAALYGKALQACDSSVEFDVLQP